MMARIGSVFFAALILSAAVCMVPPRVWRELPAKIPGGGQWDAAEVSFSVQFYSNFKTVSGQGLRTAVVDSAAAGDEPDHRRRRLSA
jgi:hypothetical protein